MVEASSASDIGRALVLIGEKWVRSLRVTFLIPFVVWFLVRRVVRAERTALRLVEIVAGLHLCILLALIIRFDYWELFSLRHVMVLAGLVLPFSAAGVMAIVDALAARWQNRSWVKIAFTGGLLAVLVAPTLPWMLQRRNAHDAYLRRAGEWIRGQTWGAAHRPDAGATPDWREAGIAPPAILTTRHQVAFYAGGMQVWSPLDADAEAILLEARTHRPGWLVFDERRMLRMSSTFFKDLEAAVLAGEVLDRVREEPSQDGKAGHRAVIYRYVAPG